MEFIWVFIGFTLYWAARNAFKIHALNNRMDKLEDTLETYYKENFITTRDAYVSEEQGEDGSVRYVVYSNHPIRTSHMYYKEEYYDIVYNGVILPGKVGNNIYVYQLEQAK